MTGGAGLSAGISQGLDKVADGLVRRQQVQQQSAMFNQQMQFNQINQGMKMQQHQSKQEKTALDIEALQLKIGEYENQLADDKKNSEHKKAIQLLSSLSYEMYGINEHGLLNKIEKLEVYLKNMNSDSENIIFKK